MTGITCELVGKYLNDQGLRALAKPLLLQAFHVFDEFGATKKCAQMLARYPQQVRLPAPSSASQRSSMTLSEAYDGSVSGHRAPTPAGTLARSNVSDSNGTGRWSTSVTPGRVKSGDAVDGVVDMESMIAAAAALSRERTVSGVLGVLIRTVMVHTAADFAAYFGVGQHGGTGTSMSVGTPLPPCPRALGVWRQGQGQVPVRVLDQRSPLPRRWPLPTE